MENKSGNNSALNNSRESVNKNASRYTILGKANRFTWDLKRSFRSI